MDCGGFFCRYSVHVMSCLGKEEQGVLFPVSCIESGEFSGNFRVTS